MRRRNDGRDLARTKRYRLPTGNVRLIPNPDAIAERVNQPEAIGTGIVKRLVGVARHEKELVRQRPGIAEQRAGIVSHRLAVANVHKRLARRKCSRALVGHIRFRGQVGQRRMSANVALGVDQQDRADGKRVMHRTGRHEHVVRPGHGTTMNQHGRIHMLIAIDLLRTAAIRPHGPQRLHGNHSFVDILPPRIENPSVLHDARRRLAQRVFGQTSQIPAVSVDSIQHVDAEIVFGITEHAPFAT